MSFHDDQIRRLSRLFVIYHMLEMCGHERRVRRSDLQAACNCTGKTIQRDLQVLNEAGASILYDRKRSSYVLERPLPILSIKLQLPDMLALVLAQGAAQRQIGVSATMQARAFNKLLSRLPISLRDEMASARKVMDFGEHGRRDYSGAPLQELIHASRTFQTVQMTYYSIGRDATEFRLVDPYTLTLRNRFLNLVAYCHKHQAVRLFSVDNILNLETTGNTFEMLKDFSLASYLEGMVGGMRGDLTEITVLFKQKVARWAEKTRFEFPHTLENTEAGLLLRGQVSGIEAISKELLRWGAQVEVLSPPELRQAMLCEVRAIAQMYRDS
jgi:predicted DNA-binding transcriptional regulator YafY